MTRTIPELPYESLVCKIVGDQWRNLPDRERDGALGVAIVKSVLDGVSPTLYELSAHLGVGKDMLWHAFRRLGMNGIFRGGRLDADRHSIESDQRVWCHYAGYASGFTGLYRDKR